VEKTPEEEEAEQEERERAAAAAADGEAQPISFDEEEEDDLDDAEDEDEPEQLYVGTRTPTFGFYETGRKLTKKEIQRRRKKLQAFMRPRPRPLLARERARAVDISNWNTRQLAWYLHRLVTGERHMESEYFFQRIPVELRTEWVYTTVIRSIARRGGAEKCENIIQEMRSRGMKPNLHIYMLLLDIYAKRPDQPNLDRTLAALHEDGLTPDIHMYVQCFITTISTVLS